MLYIPILFYCREKLLSLDILWILQFSCWLMRTVLLIFRMSGLLHSKSRSLRTHCVPMSFSLAVFITAVSLQAQNVPKQRSIDLSVTWNGPTELLHGIFQGYEIFYRDTNLGKEFNVTLRTSDAFYEIRDLQYYTKYMITARSFTLEGEGRMSEPIYVWTAPTGNFSYSLLLPHRLYQQGKVC